MNDLPIELIQYIISLLPKAYIRRFTCINTKYNKYKIPLGDKYHFADELCEIGLFDDVYNIVHDSLCGPGLRLGVKYNNKDLLTKLFIHHNNNSNNNNKDIYDDTSYHLCDLIAEYDQIDLIDYALSKGINDAYIKDSAIQFGSLPVLKWYYEYYNRDHCPAFYVRPHCYKDCMKLAFQHDRLPIIKWLISLGYKYDNKCILLARNHKDILEFISTTTC